jgi:hypothetical protein
MWNVKAEVTPLIMGDWNHFKITQTLLEQHTGKAQNQGTTKTSHIGHCTHTAEITDAEVPNIFNVRNNVEYIL